MKHVFRLAIVVLGVSLLLWAGCDTQQALGPEAELDQRVLAFSTADPQFQAVIAVQDRVSDALMQRPEVIGTGAGLTEDGRPALVVLARSPLTTGDPAKGAAVPDQIDEVPVVVLVIGEIKARAKFPLRRLVPSDSFPRPVPIGVSTGHPDITAGTIGARVKRGNTFYALSNNHVYANTNNASIGDLVIQQGTFDGGEAPEDAIGRLRAFEPIVFCNPWPTNCPSNSIDAALATTRPTLIDNATPSDGYGTPQSQTVAPTVGLHVMKYGRTTVLTAGNISAINATIDVGYDDVAPNDSIARFVGQIVITSGSFSAGGDSGSLIVVRGGADRLKPVGLLFAGSTTTTIANVIGDVLSNWGITIDGQ